MKYDKATPNMMARVKRIAQTLHRRLDGAKIAVITCDKAGSRGGKTILASASKPSAKMKPLLDAKYSFVITIAADAWEKLDNKQRDALIDHELCHCEYNEKMEPALRGHDLEEFAEIIERHGFWRKDQGESVVQQAVMLQDIEVGTITETAEDKRGADEMEEAIILIKSTGRASTSMLQRRMRIGYTRAARIMDVLEEKGIIGPPRGSDPREILVELDG